MRDRIGARKRHNTQNANIYIIQSAQIAKRKENVILPKIAKIFPTTTRSLFIQYIFTELLRCGDDEGSSSVKKKKEKTHTICGWRKKMKNKYEERKIVAKQYIIHNNNDDDKNNNTSV